MLKNENYWSIAQNFLQKSREYYLKRDPENIGEIASEIMKADMLFNGSGHLNGYRYKRAVWKKFKLVKQYVNRDKFTFFSDMSNPTALPIPTKDTDLHEDVRYRVKQLPDIQQKCITLYYLNQDSLSTISKTLGMPRATIYTHIQKGLDRLRKMYDKKDIL